MADRLKRIILLGNVFLLPQGLAAAPVGRPEVLGTIVGSGMLWVDRLPAPPGTTLFAHDVIATGSNSLAVVNFLSEDSAAIGAGTEIALASGPAFGSDMPTNIELRRGSLIVRSAGGSPLVVGVTGASLLVKGQSSLPAVSRVTALGDSATVFAERGSVVIQGSGTRIVLAPGKSLRLEAGRAQLVGQPSGPVIGRVAQSAPDETVKHSGSGLPVPLRLGEVVNQADRIQTSATGRVRVQLLDGSFVNLGADTSMTIFRHDPQQQQTQLELDSGRLRAEVAKPSQPSASFEVRTSTSVVQTPGTVFVLEARTKFTSACDAGEGPLVVRSSAAGVPGQVTLHKGECANVKLFEAPGQPEQDPARINREMALTGFAGVPSIYQTAKIHAINQAAVGAHVLAAILGGVSFGLIRSADEDLKSANSNLKNAVNALHNATTSADSASANSRQLCLAFVRFFEGFGVSPSAPVPSCP